MRTSCSDATGDRRLLVALGTSETAGWGIIADHGQYSPQAAFPALYADMLCTQLTSPIELHSFFPSQVAGSTAPLSWWMDRIENDGTLRADLAAADVVVLWALSSHDSVVPMLSGACGHAAPEDVAVCFSEQVGDLTQQTDTFFGKLADIIRDGATVLAADAYAPPFITSQDWWQGPYRDDVRRVVDPYFAVSVAAPTHEFVFIDTERAFNGSTLAAAPAGLFQPDGLHPTPAGQQLIAATLIARDGLGD